MYISGVNNGIRTTIPLYYDVERFRYGYSWSFCCAGVSFLLAMLVSVVQITLYFDRYTYLEDLIEAIPGLAEKMNHAAISNRSRSSTRKEGQAGEMELQGIPLHATLVAGIRSRNPALI